MDLSTIANAVGTQLGVSVLRTSVTNLDSRFDALEIEFRAPEGFIQTIERKLEEIEARRDSASVTRGGYTFRDESDVQALLEISSDTDVHKYFLDVYSLLTLSQEPFSTYAQGIKVRADAIKAKFDSVLESRVTLSYDIPFPKVMIRKIESVDTVAKGGVKWAPMSTSAEAFEDQFRIGSHCQVLESVEKAYELMQATVYQNFPLHREECQTR